MTSGAKPYNSRPDPHSPEIQSLQEKDFEKENLKAVERLAVIFESPWCHGCSAVEALIHGLTDEEAKGYQWGKVDISIHQEIALRFGVLSVPTLLFFSQGEAVKRLVGQISKEKLLSSLEP